MEENNYKKGISYLRILQEESPKDIDSFIENQGSNLGNYLKNKRF